MPTENERQELAKKSDLLTKQDTLIPGTGISIAPDGKTISATGAGGSTVEVTPIQVTGTRIAAMTVDGNIISLYAPTPPTVSATQIVQSGVELARVTINGVNTSIYAPETSTVLSGTTTPTSQQGSDGDLYVQYDGTTGDVIMTYVKLDGAWVELSAGGGSGLPENWTVNESYLRANALTDTNELGWGVHNDTYYYDTAASVYNHGREYKKSNAIPALGGLVKCGGWITPIFTSTDASATNVDSYGATPTAFQYNGKTWYWGGGLNGAWPQMDNVANIEYIGEFDTWQAGAIWLIDNSGVYFDDYANTFNQIMEPSTGYLFAGGGTQNNLSDATFKVTSEGEVNGTDFKVGGSSILAPFTGSNGSTAGTKGMVPAPAAADKDKFLKGDGTWDEAGAVDDVKVNGTSVVDANKIAQIKSYKELTQAQYNALSSAEKNNGTLYCITDASANGNLEDLGNVNISNPSDGDVVKWDTTNQEWIAGEGGTGNVADVYVNGTSVLDSNKIAQITNYVEVTQAEYDALPASKLTDNILYCIKDQVTADTTVAPIIYSTDEREIGVWIDGKPLYQKTVQLSNLTIPSNNRVITSLTNCGILNAETIVKADGIMILNNIPTTIPAYQVSTFSDYANAFYVNSTDGIVISRGHYSSITADFYITIQYTKTTDTPGSGKYAPSGVPAVHYSTDEQVIGTWVDGSPIYQKTLQFTNLSTNTPGWTVLTKFEGIDNMISMTGHAINISTLQQIFLNSIYISITYLNEYIQYYCENVSSWIINIYLTIQYTKSTS